MWLVPLTDPLVSEVSSWVTSREEATIVAGPNFTFPVTAASFADIAAQGWDTFGLIEAHGELVGTGSILYKPGGRARIGRVLLSPKRRGQGQGRELMTELMTQTLSHDEVHILELSVFQENTPAANLYRSLGFGEVSQPELIQLGDKIWHGVQMEKVC